MKIAYRQADTGDIDKIVELEKKVWGRKAATHEMVASRINVFRDGNIIALQDKNLVGVVFFQIVDWEKLSTRCHSWEDYTDSGLIKKTHTYNGDTIFGIGLSVLPGYRGLKIGSYLLLESFGIAVKYNIQRAFLGCRIPDFHKFSHLNVEKYIDMRTNNGKKMDPELRFYERLDITTVKALPNYFPDPESKNYGVLLQWRNPFFSKRFGTRFLVKILVNFLPIYFRLKYAR